MKLTITERIEIITISMQKRVTQWEITNIFNTKYPNRVPVTQSAVSKLLAKFKQTGSVEDRIRKGRPPLSHLKIRDVLDTVRINPHFSTRCIAQQLQIANKSVHRILKSRKFHPYKMQLICKIHESDYLKRLHFCNFILAEIETKNIDPRNILWSDESIFQIDGFVNKQTYRYWSDINPHWTSERKRIGSAKIMVWAGICGEELIGPYFFDENVNADNYLYLLENYLPQQYINHNICPSNVIFMQDGASPHYAHIVRNF